MEEGRGKMEEGSNHPVRLRFATARHPATIGGDFFRRDPGVKHRDDLLNHYPVRLRFATARHPATIGGEFYYHYPVLLRSPPLRQRRGIWCDYIKRRGLEEGVEAGAFN
ncbi:MAG: hypothetical protein LBB23_02690 [Rickettsiales bacterium]|jgi:hypothetical protein|nr:hypothetical protein [Rickettsiales bacterium]